MSVAMKLNLSRRVVELLGDQGLLVLKVDVDAHRPTPVIWIARSPLCERLRGTTSTERMPDESLLRTVGTNLYGCRVQWSAE